MSFFSLSDGSIASGAAEKAHHSVYRVIPNDSKLLAILVKIEKKQGRSPFYQITWEIANGDYKGQRIRQSIFCWTPDPKLCDRAKEMMMRIFKCCAVPPPQMEPTAHDLYQLESKMCGIKITERDYINKEGKQVETNDVSEVHPSKNFVEEIGVKLPPKPKLSKPMGGYNEINPPFLDDDISF